MKPRFLHLPGLILGLGLAQGSLLAQENQELGRMWTYENPPLAYLEKEYGFKPDQQWLASLRLSALRLGGETITQGFCSASFVSPRGLIMTNNHCVRGAVNTTRGPKVVKSGYYATSLEDEIRLKTEDDGWLTVSQLHRTVSVTDRVNTGIADGDSEADVKKKREANKKKILAEAEKNDPDLVPQIVSLYQGGIYQLYQYKVYDDIRLVCTPHLQTAHFGGDPDNFTYPRYSIDFAFVRAYVEGKPADTTKHYFKWKLTGAKKGDLVFVPGNPGSTERLNTKAQMDFLRDFRQPIILEMLTNRLTVFRNLIEQRPGLKERFRTMMLEWENGEKAIGGELRGLRHEELMAQKVRAESAFKARVMKVPALAKKYGDLWDKIAETAAGRRELEPALRFHGIGNSSLLSSAVELVQALDPDEPDDGRDERIEEARKMDVRMENPITMHLFVDHVKRARKWLNDDDPFFATVLGGETAPEFLRRMIGSSIPSAKFRKKLIDGGWDAVQASGDAAIVAARKLVPLMRAAETKDEELGAKEETLGAKMGLALFACYGTKVSPDATMTPRFADGVVKGFEFNGTIAPFRTSFYGLYARNSEFDDEYPFDLPAIWLERRSKVDMTKSVNFVSTNDIVGGNSGSVVVSKELEVVGLIFDGNIESLHNSYVFRDDVPRSVSVHVEGIMEALKKIYDADRVVKELLRK